MVQTHKATTKHADIIVEFQQKMAYETEKLILDKDTVTHGVNAVLSDDSKGVYFVTSFEEQIVGTMLITREWSDWRNSWVFWLQSVYIISEMRGKKVFKAMFDFMSTKVEKYDDVAGLRLYVDKNNKNAMAVYEALGMNGDHYKVFEIMK